MKKLETIQQYTVSIIAIMIALFVWSACGVKSNIAKKVDALDEIDFNYKNPQIVNGINYSDSFFFKALRAMQEEKYDNAIKLFKKFVALNPTEPAGYYHLAKLYAIENADFSRAITNSKKAYYLNEDNKWYRTLYADLLANEGKYYDAGKLYDDYISKGNYDKDLFIKEIVYFLRAKSYKKVLAVIDQMDTYTDIDDIIAEEMRLEVYKEQEDLDKAELSLQKLAQMDSTNNDYKLILAEFYQKTNQSQQADSIFTSLQFDSTNDEDRITYLYSLMQQNDTQTLGQIINTAYSQSSLDTNQIAYLQVAIINSASKFPSILPFYINQLKALNNTDDASLYVPEFLAGYYQYNKEDKNDYLKYAHKAMDKGSKDLSIFTSLMSHYLEQEAYDSLVDFSQLAISSRDSFSIGYYSLALAYYNKKENDSTIKYMLLAVEHADVSYTGEYKSDAYGLLGDVYHSMNKYKASYNAYDSALHYNSRNETVLNNYAYFLSEDDTSRLQLAAEMSEKSLSIAPNQPSFLDTYGWIKYLMGDYETAKTYIRKAIDYSTNPSAELWNHLGDVEQKLGNVEKAKDYWKLAIEAGGNETEINLKINSVE